MDDSGAFLFLLLPLFPIVFIGFWLAIAYLLSHVSGWRVLAAQYATQQQPTGTHFRFCSAALRGVSFRSALNLAASPDGLFLWPFLPFRPAFARLFVPWSDLAADLDKRWLVTYVALHFAKAPGLRLRIRSTLAERLAAASGGALRISAGPN
jgi:hypothetical protein